MFQTIAKDRVEQQKRRNVQKANDTEGRWNIKFHSSIVK